MEIDVGQYDSIWGWWIFARGVTPSELRVMLRLVKRLGLKKNLKEELRSWYLGAKIAPRDLAVKVYTRRGECFTVSYLHRRRMMGATWKSPRFDGHEFASLYLSTLSGDS